MSVKKIEIMLDKKKIREFDDDTYEYEETLDNFNIKISPFDRDVVEIDFGFGQLKVSKELFDKALQEYNKQVIEFTAEYHFKKLIELLEDDKKAKTALAVLKKRIEGVEC